MTSERPRRERQVRHDLLLPPILAVVALGGAAGAVARYGLDLLLPPEPGAIPWATLLANVLGSLLIGVSVVWLLERRHPSRWAHPFLATGVLGGFTTFSAYAVQTRVLLGTGEVAVALAYVVATLALTLVAVRLGTVAARRVWGVHP